MRHENTAPPTCQSRRRERLVPRRAVTGARTLAGGRITAAARPGGGALCRFTLPLAAEPPEVRTDDA
jgi:hypothetical protein